MSKYIHKICLLLICFAVVIRVESRKINVSINIPTNRDSSGLRKFVEPFPPYAQFSTGAIVGFAASRVVVQTAVRIVKVVGTVFILSEVLNRTGYLDVDYMDNMNRDNFIRKMEMKSKHAINDFRMFTEKHIEQAPSDIRAFIRQGFGGQKEHTNHLSAGIAAGAVTGFLL